MGEYFFTAFDNYTLFHSTAYMGGTAGFLPVSNVDTIKEKKTSRFHGSNGRHVELVSFPMCYTRPRFGLGLHVSRFMHLHVLFLFCIRRCKGKIRYHEAKGVQPPCSITLFSYVQILFSLLFVKAWLYPRLVGSLGGTLALPARRAGGYGS